MMFSSVFIIVSAAYSLDRLRSGGFAFFNTLLSYCRTSSVSTFGIRFDAVFTSMMISSNGTFLGAMI